MKKFGMKSFLKGMASAWILIIILFYIIFKNIIYTPEKQIIDSGCGYYNSDKDFIIKDECKKYYENGK